MADLKCITSPVVVTESRCYTTYVGAREELISAGIAQDHHFAEGRKRVKYFDTDAGDLWSTHKLKGGKFEMVKRHAPRWTAGVGEPRKTKAPPAHPNSVRRELILLDFKPYDILEDLERLREMVESGEINGLLFAAKYTKPGKHRNFFGASGRYSENIEEAFGAAAMLQRELLEKM